MQAARGASLTEPGTSEHRHDSPPSRRPRRLLTFVSVAVLAYALDVVTKSLAVAMLSGRPPVHVVGDLLTLQLARNPGAAFSTATSYTLALSCLAIVAALVVVGVARRVRSTGWAIGLGLLLAGICGNLTDRIFREPGVLRGHVVDFLALPHWPVFNVADMCIDVAAAFIIVQAIRGIRVDGSRHDER
jgi:signal peptidase II